MKLIPYFWPLFPEFKTARFKRATRKAAPAIDALIGDDPDVYRYPKGPWIAGPPLFKAYRANMVRAWKPKLYVCLGAKDYWPGILALARVTRKHPVQWKFHRHKLGLDRPDKIVFYFRSERELRAYLPRIRRALAGRSFRTMHHAASTAAMGFEPASAKGLYVGADPHFLRPTSWREYRCMIQAFIMKFSDYLEGLPGGLERWCERMNVSLAHEGPRTLSPTRDNRAYVRRYWRMIFPVELRTPNASSKKTSRKKGKKAA
ncbi:MAG: hypothetical protein U0174_14975 [Polyangiaceae bacterium]